MRDLVETVILADMRRRGVAPRDLVAAHPAPRPARDARLWDACRRFEALLFAQMMQAMQPKGSAWFGGGFAGSVHAMFLQQAVADAASRSSPLGLARVLYAELARQAPAQAGRQAADEGKVEVRR